MARSRRSLASSPPQLAVDGVPGNGTPLDQDFALVINNGTECGGGGITLTATVQQKNDQVRVNLDWDPADGGQINVLRNDNIVQTTADDGNTKEKLGTHTGTFTYQVCETDSGDCSNEMDVTVP